MGRRPKDESPVALEGGRWVNDRGIQRWVPDPNATPPPPPSTLCRDVDCDTDVAIAGHGGRGLCRPCYTRHHKAGSIHQFQRTRWSEDTTPPGVACPVCHAAETEACRTTTSDKPRRPHHARTVPRKCLGMCGSSMLTLRTEFCDQCWTSVNPARVDRIMDGDWSTRCTPPERVQIIERWVTTGGTLSELQRRVTWNVWRAKREVAA